MTWNLGRRNGGGGGSWHISMRQDIAQVQHYPGWPLLVTGEG